MYLVTDKCLVCRKVTHGAIFCSLEHHQEYERNKTKYKRKKVIIEIKEEKKTEKEQFKESVEEFKKKMARRAKKKNQKKDKKTKKKTIVKSKKKNKKSQLKSMKKSFLDTDLGEFILRQSERFSSRQVKHGVMHRGNGPYGREF